MARKKAQRKQETTLVPHKTPNLSALLERAKSGSAQAVKAYLDAGGSPMALVQWQERHHLQLPLFSVVHTSRHAHTELAESVRLLLDAGVDINAKAAGPDGDERTALMCAAQCCCCTAVVDVLLQAGADACLCSSLKRMTALHIAAMAGSAGCCESLLARADILLGERDVNGWTALMYAAYHGCLNAVQLLLQHGADIATVDIKGNNALMLAARASNIAVAQLLLDHGADLRSTDSKGQTALFKLYLMGMCL
jgi:ankyrin repeat protein